MALTREITYFNSFIIKKTVEDGRGKASWPSLPWDPTGYPQFPLEVSTESSDVEYDWYVEESRIRGGYNNTQVDLGVKAYITETEDTELILGNGLIYSGLYNSRTGVNETNVFSTGENITKEVDPRYGGIQKLYTTDTNLIIFQEDKVSNALIDKDAIYTADGNPALTATQLVIGQINQYSGEYGISDNPESFAFKGYRMYFSDKNRGAIMRLSRDGLTEISRYGMRDYFRDALADISESFDATSEIVFYSLSPVFAPVGPGEPTPTSTDTWDIVGGVNDSSVSKIELGMATSRAFGGLNGIYVISITSINTTNNTATIKFNQTVQTNNLASVDLYLIKFVKDKVVGTYDNYYDKYVVSMQQTDLQTYNTVSFNDSNNGWTSFWDYEPSFGGTLNNIYYTAKGGSIWKHYDESVINNRGTFYGTYYPTSVQLSFNPMVSVPKNFNTVNYEGTNGWQVDFFLSDPTGKLILDAQRNDYKDEASTVKSYEEGAYVEAGVTYRVGFNKKENKYMANLVSNGVQVNGNNNIQFGMPGQVASNISMSGIKGFYATVKLSTDDTTDIGGFKNLFAVSSNFVKS
jgi:hypothetical protein